MTVPHEEKKRPWVYLPASRALLMFLGFFILAIGLAGALTFALVRQQSTTATSQYQQKEIDQILSYVSLQKASPTQQAGNAWLVKQMENICTALQTRPNGLPSCQVVPLPPAIQQLLNQSKIK